MSEHLRYADSADPSGHTSARVGIVGSGVSGLVAALTAARAGHDVVLYEADERLGGHADTHLVREGETELHIDTGFIVHNRHTYPILCRIFDELDVDTIATEMSMSVVDEASGLQWAGAKGIAGLFTTPQRLLDLGHWRMLLEIPRFQREARRLVAAQDRSEETLDAFVDRHKFSDRLKRHYIRALVAAVWSCEPELAGQYPARYLFSFLANHGMLSVLGSPQWYTIAGGSREYVDRICKQLPDVRIGTRVERITELEDAVAVTEANGRSEKFDRVIIATHPGQALALLGEPTAAQRDVLGHMPYSPNTALLHTDESILPSALGARSSWNLRLPTEGSDHVTVTYDLTRLQRLDTDTRYLVTLGGEHLIDPAKVIDRMEYEHPQYTPESVAAQTRLADIETERIAFAGAYHGWGFHEDGARSGVLATERLGLSTPVAKHRHTTAPRVYETTVRHLRQQPMRTGFSRRSTMWVVDIDEQSRRQSSYTRSQRLTRGTIDARDHLGDPKSTLRENLARFLAGQGIELADATVQLMAHPRALGYCFNPISVWWCTRSDGTELATVVEVHNTYGDRHAYLLEGDPSSTHSVDKAMYVSPFHAVEGTYRVSAPQPTDTLDIRVDLELPNKPTFHASLEGRLTDNPSPSHLAHALRDRLAITAHGIALWLRRLPIQARPEHHQEAVK